MEFAWKVKEMCPRAKLSPVYCSWWSQHYPESNQYWNFAARSCHVTGTFDFLGAKKKTVKKRPLKKKEDGDPKKKRWADDGRRWAMCPSNKKKEDGRPKKKRDGETIIFFRSFFGAHLSPIPNHESNLKILKRPNRITNRILNYIRGWIESRIEP